MGFQIGNDWKSPGTIIGNLNSFNEKLTQTNHKPTTTPITQQSTTSTTALLPRTLA